VPTPHTQALHVIERYRLVDYEAAKEALERGARENASFVRNDSGVIVDLNSKAKHLQLQFTVEDEGAFTTPWSATVIYRPGLGAASLEAPHLVRLEPAEPAVPRVDRLFADPVPLGYRRNRFAIRLPDDRDHLLFRMQPPSCVPLPSRPKSVFPQHLGRCATPRLARLGAEPRRVPFDEARAVAADEFVPLDGRRAPGRRRSLNWFDFRRRCTIRLCIRQDCRAFACDSACSRGFDDAGLRASNSIERGDMADQIGPGF
jgi:hypothetical protein